MNIKKRIVSVLLLIGLLVTSERAVAQEQPVLTAVTLGITSPFLDNGVGFHLGLNPSKALSSHLALEGQLSYTFTHVSGGFLSGDVGTMHAINTLVGGRFYVHTEERPTRWYVNALAGGLYNSEQSSRKLRSALLGVGASVGMFVERECWLIGFSLETPQNAVLKFGYRF